jgi:transcriptional regulator with XRE-family HTH domain
MDWKRLINELMEAGHTQTRIGEVCGVAQSTISDLARGASKSPTYELGAKLIELRDAARADRATLASVSAGTLTEADLDARIAEKRAALADLGG